MKTLGTSACPPYHLAIVIGGTSAEATVKTVKLASTKWLDELPTTGSKAGSAFRDIEMEQKVLEISRNVGIGAQFGGKYFCHDVRVIRLPRHGASLPVGIGVSCSADRQIKAKITPDDSAPPAPCRKRAAINVPSDCPTRWQRSIPSAASHTSSTAA